MSPSSQPSFLSRPHSLEEIANMLGISSSKAEEFVIKAVESGELLVVSPSSPNNKSRSTLQTFTASKPGPFYSALGQALKGHRFRLADSRVHSRTFSGKRAELFFKLHSGNANSFQKHSTSRQIPILYGRQGKPPMRGRMTILQHIQVLEAVGASPRRLDEIRARTQVSRSSLENMVRKGLISSYWGLKGVGRFYRITRNGQKELERLKLASTIASTIPKKQLISLKTSAPQMGL